MPLLRSNPTHHAQEPSTPWRVRQSLPRARQANPCYSHMQHTPAITTDMYRDASERRRHFCGAAILSLPEQQPVKPQPWQRPETHQNLIHPDKEHSTQNRGHLDTGTTATANTRPGARQTGCAEFLLHCDDRHETLKAITIPPNLS